MKSGVSPQKLRKHRRQTPIWASICTPVAPSLLIFSGHSPRLRGHNFRSGGAQAVIWGGTAPECPPVALGLQVGLQKKAGKEVKVYEYFKKMSTTNHSRKKSWKRGDLQKMSLCNSTRKIGGKKVLPYLLDC